MICSFDLYHESPNHGFRVFWNYGHEQKNKKVFTSRLMQMCRQVHLGFVVELSYYSGVFGSICFTKGKTSAQKILLQIVNKAKSTNMVFG